MKSLIGRSIWARGFMDFWLLCVGISAFQEFQNRGAVQKKKIGFKDRGGPFLCRDKNDDKLNTKSRRTAYQSKFNLQIRGHSDSLVTLKAEYFSREERKSKKAE